MFINIDPTITYPTMVILVVYFPSQTTIQDEFIPLQGVPRRACWQAWRGGVGQMSTKMGSSKQAKWQFMVDLPSGELT